MKINRLEAHDRLLHLKKDQSINIAQGAEDCLKKNPLSLALQRFSSYVYLFAHPRTADDGVNKRMVWQARLTKPALQTNSYLFRAISNTDQLEICWLLPPKEMWPQYKTGNVTQHELVNWSIEMFTNNKKALETIPQDDLSDEQIKNIYIIVSKEMDEEKRMNKLYKAKPDSLEDYPTSLI